MELLLLKHPKVSRWQISLFSSQYKTFGLVSGKSTDGFSLVDIHYQLWCNKSLFSAVGTSLKGHPERNREVSKGTLSLQRNLEKGHLEKLR